MIRFLVSYIYITNKIIASYGSDRGFAAFNCDNPANKLTFRKTVVSLSLDCGAFLT